MERIFDLLEAQSGVVSRRQVLASGATRADLRRWLRRRDLVPMHRGVYVNHTGEPTWLQRAWAAVLSLWPAVLAGESALRAAEGPGRRPDPDPLDVVVASSRRVAAPPGVGVVRRVHLDELALWNTSPPRLRYEVATLDVAVRAPTDLAAVGVLAESLQSRRTTAARLQDALSKRRRTPRRSWLDSVLADLADGTCSVLEVGFLRRVERPHGLPRGRRQVRAVGAMGAAYRDAEYDGLVIELDGRLFHDNARQRDRDMDRDLDTHAEGRAPVRLGYGQVFGRPCATAARLEAVFRRQGWRGRARPCGPGCVLRAR